MYWGNCLISIDQWVDSTIVFFEQQMPALGRKSEIEQHKICIILGFGKRNRYMKRKSGPNMMFYRQFKLWWSVKCMFSQKQLLISQVLLNFTSSMSPERLTLDRLRATLPLERHAASMIGSDTRTTLLSSKPTTCRTFAGFDLSDIADFVGNQQRHPNAPPEWCKKLCFATVDNAQQPVLQLSLAGSD